MGFWGNLWSGHQTSPTVTTSPGYASIADDNNINSTINHTNTTNTDFEGLPVAVAVAVVDHDFDLLHEGRYNNNINNNNHAPPLPSLPPPPPMNPQYVPSAPPSAPPLPSTAPLSPLSHWPRRPTLVPQCPHCAACHRRTRTRTYPHWLTWLSCVILLVLCWPLCWIPLVLEMTQQTEHYCSACQAMVGTVLPFQDCCVTQRQ